MRGPNRRPENLRLSTPRHRGRPGHLLGRPPASRPLRRTQFAWRAAFPPVTGQGAARRRRRGYPAMPAAVARRNLRYADTAALFTGAGRHSSPMQQAFFCTGWIQFHFGAFGKQRHDARHAQLRRLLHNQIHLFAARHTLRQRQPQRRFVGDSTHGYRCATSHRACPRQSTWQRSHDRRR